MTATSATAHRRSSSQLDGGRTCATGVLAKGRVCQGRSRLNRKATHVLVDIAVAAAEIAQESTDPDDITFWEGFSESALDQADECYGTD